jgi:FMN phosphatase YigB (HAD superfamily)
MRKPEQRIFQKVLKDARLISNETLFIDDNADNIKSAAVHGIQTILHKANSDLRQSFVLNGYLLNDEL